MLDGLIKDGEPFGPPMPLLDVISGYGHFSTISARSKGITWACCLSLDEGIPRGCGSSVHLLQQYQCSGGCRSGVRGRDMTFFCRVVGVENLWSAVVSNTASFIFGSSRPCLVVGCLLALSTEHVVFQSRVFHPLVSSDTGEMDVKSGFPEWRKNVNHLWQVVQFVRRAFYKIETKSAINKEAATLGVEPLDTVGSVGGPLTEQDLLHHWMVSFRYTCGWLEQCCRSDGWCWYCARNGWPSNSGEVSVPKSQVSPGPKKFSSSALLSVRKSKPSFLLSPSDPMMVSGGKPALHHRQQQLDAWPSLLLVVSVGKPDSSAMTPTPSSLFCTDIRISTPWTVGLGKVRHPGPTSSGCEVAACPGVKADIGGASKVRCIPIHSSHIRSRQPAESSSEDRYTSPLDHWSTTSRRSSPSRTDLPRLPMPTTTALSHRPFGPWAGIGVFPASPESGDPLSATWGHDKLRIVAAPKLPWSHCTLSDHVSNLFTLFPCLYSGFLGQNHIALYEDNKELFREKVRDCVKESQEHVYDPPEIDDPHYISFDPYDEELHGPIREAIFRPKEFGWDHRKCSFDTDFRFKRVPWT
ncbi:hypothetical protein PR048_016116 [Dryococelus australis]|uniref:Uncharacterized protein n=1 Tax=Dryococelus australis TaxID=614101 RepID=A0ABQ9HJ79_9NEOP|nr:hypothetical protein PR048_016116 [Dryococelus australis]